jgi:hypothetical protein
VAGKAISGSRARRNIRIAQTAGVALGVSAAALWALQVPIIESPLPVKPEIQPVAGPEPEPSAAAPSQPLDREGVLGAAERLELAARIQRPTETASGPAEATTPAAAPNDWKYVGSIREPSRMLALVSRGGGKQQRLMAAGREWDGVKLLAVNESEIQIEDSSGRQTIPRAERNGPSVQWTKMASNAPAANPAAQPGMTNAAMAKGIDPTQAAAMRQALAEKAAGRRRGQPVGTTMSPQMLRELGLTDKEAASMTEDQLQELRQKYDAVARERAGATGGDADGAAAPGDRN